MNAESFREFCLSLPHTTEGFPFDEHTLVFKVGGKMYALIGLDQGDRANLKCDPDRAVELRMEWEEIQPGYHMSKVHWNTVHFTGRLGDAMIQELIRHSYDLVRSSLPKKVQATLGG